MSSLRRLYKETLHQSVDTVQLSRLYVIHCLYLHYNRKTRQYLMHDSDVLRQCLLTPWEVVNKRENNEWNPTRPNIELFVTSLSFIVPRPVACPSHT